MLAVSLLSLIWLHQWHYCLDLPLVHYSAHTDRTRSSYPRYTMQPFRASLLLFLFLLLLSPRAALADFSLLLYSDARCTVPLPAFPAVSNAAVAVMQNQSVCAPASHFTPLWLPSPTSAPAQWLSYACDPTDGGFEALTVAVYTASNASSQCPLNTTDPALGGSAALFFGYTPPSQPCRLAIYVVPNATSHGYDVTFLFGNYTCTSNASQPNHALPRATVASAAIVLQLLLAPLLLTVLATFTAYEVDTPSSPASPPDRPTPHSHLPTLQLSTPFRPTQPARSNRRFLRHTRRARRKITCQPPLVYANLQELAGMLAGPTQRGSGYCIRHREQDGQLVTDVTDADVTGYIQCCQERGVAIEWIVTPLAAAPPARE